MSIVDQLYFRTKMLVRVTMLCKYNTLKARIQNKITNWYTGMSDTKQILFLLTVGIVSIVLLITILKWQYALLKYYVNRFVRMYIETSFYGGF